MQKLESKALKDLAFFCLYFRELVAQFHMEVGYICHTFFDYKLAHEHLMAAKKCTGLQIDLTGKPWERNLHENLSKIILECILDVVCLYFLTNYTFKKFCTFFDSIYEKF